MSNILTGMEQRRETQRQRNIRAFDDAMDAGLRAELATGRPLSPTAARWLTERYGFSDIDEDSYVNPIEDVVEPSGAADVMGALLVGFNEGENRPAASPGTMLAQAPGMSNVMSDAPSDVIQIPDAMPTAMPAQEAPTDQPTTTTTRVGNTPPVNRELSFAPHVDPRINEGIANKIKQIEGSFGSRLTVTSGYRDPARNARVGGARNSAHTRANAVDVQFRGNQEDTVKLIEAASAAGIGGIGVYRPGWLHLDTENKRVWGPDFSARTIPQWAQQALQAHMSGRSARQTTQDATAVETPTAEGAAMTEGASGAGGGGAPAATPMAAEGGDGGAQLAAAQSGGGPTPQAATPMSGLQVMGASQENDMAERTQGPPNIVMTQQAPAGDASPGTPVPGVSQSADDPGPVEPDDAAERYARLFNMAA